jgi:pyruvate/2-oxoglutarate/acetoin dehydrogenase E1 component
MALLSDAGAVFLGQAVACDGTAMRSTLKHLPPERLIEMPVAENMQAGMCTGIAIAGGLPVCCYPRINFMLEAVSQIVQHLDKLPLYSDYRPRVIIRTAIATNKPLDPGPQHVGNYVPAFRSMLKTIHV